MKGEEVRIEERKRERERERERDQKGKRYRERMRQRVVMETLIREQFPSFYDQTTIIIYKKD